jgi:heme-degrading monooxygenase HmoA
VLPLLSHRILIFSSRYIGLLLIYFEHYEAVIQKEGMGMHIQIVNFQLKDLTEEAYGAMCDELAPAVAALPGLISKVWLADAATKTYGGVYTWETRASADRFKGSDIFQAVRTNPHLTALTLREFEFLERPSAITRGVPARVAR